VHLEQKEKENKKIVREIKFPFLIIVGCGSFLIFSN
jgi:hypothetical protein